MKENNLIGLKIVGMVIGICAIFYVILFLAINYTSSPEKHPSSLLWDNKRQGYTPDPLKDRYWELRKKEDY